MAQFEAGEATRGLYTGLEALSRIASGYLRNAIAAAEIVRSLGRTSRRWSTEPARRAIEGAGLASDGQTWIERLLQAATKETANA